MSCYILLPIDPDCDPDCFLECNHLHFYIECIGVLQPGHGSAFAKGCRYLRSKIGCSGRAIKRAISLKKKYINYSEFNVYGPYVFFVPKVYCADIIGNIFDFISQHSNSIVQKAYVKNSGNFKCSQIYALHLERLKWVGNVDYRGEGDSAKKVLNDFGISV